MTMVNFLLAHAPVAAAAQRFAAALPAVEAGGAPTLDQPTSYAVALGIEGHAGRLLARMPWPGGQGLRK